jgi:hypothetical protein
MKSLFLQTSGESQTAKLQTNTKKPFHWSKKVIKPTKWNRVLLEKLTVAQIDKKIPSSYEDLLHIRENSEPQEFRSFSHLYFLKINLNIILP